MKEKLKRQKLKQYVPIALAVIVIAWTAMGFSIEGNDSKLADG